MICPHTPRPLCVGTGSTPFSWGHACVIVEMPCGSVTSTSAQLRRWVAVYPAFPARQKAGCFLQQPRQRHTGTRTPVSAKLDPTWLAPCVQRRRRCRPRPGLVASARQHNSRWQGCSAFENHSVASVNAPSMKMPENGLIDRTKPRQPRQRHFSGATSHSPHGFTRFRPGSWDSPFQNFNRHLVSTREVAMAYDGCDRLPDTWWSSWRSMSAQTADDARKRNRSG